MAALHKEESIIEGAALLESFQPTRHLLASVEYIDVEECKAASSAAHFWCATYLAARICSFIDVSRPQFLSSFLSKFLDETNMKNRKIWPCIYDEEHVLVVSLMQPYSVKPLSDIY